MIGFPIDSHVVYDENGVPEYDRAIGSAPYRKLLRTLFSSGILPTDSLNLQVRPGEDMTVIVHPGFAMVDGCMKLEENSRTLIVQAPDSLYDRIDTVVMRLNDNDTVRSCDLYVIQGIPAVRPVRPDLTRTDAIFELGLADLFIAKNASAISTARITDTRYESERCGVISSISQFDTTTLYDQVQADLKMFREISEKDFAEWQEACEGAMENWTGNQKDSFQKWQQNLQDEIQAYFEMFQTTVGTWFDHIKDSLDDDVATNLQKQIDEIKYYYVIEDTLYVPQTSASISEGILMLGTATGQEAENESGEN